MLIQINLLRTLRRGESEKCIPLHCNTSVRLAGADYTNETFDNMGCIFNGFYYKASKEADCGGHLFSIVLLPDSEDYTVFPSYDYLGMLKTPDGEFNMIALYPTDVQFSEGTSAEYGEMTDDINRIIKTVKAMGGAEFVKG